MTFWKQAGMSYLRYVNLCGDLVRAGLKEPARTAAKSRESVYFKKVAYSGSKPEPAVITDRIVESAKKK